MVFNKRISLVWLVERNMAFNENTRVKIPAILHLTQLGYEYVSLQRENQYDMASNMFKRSKKFEKAILDNFAKLMLEWT